MLASTLFFCLMIFNVATIALFLTLYIIRFRSNMRLLDLSLVSGLAVIILVNLYWSSVFTKTFIRYEKIVSSTKECVHERKSPRYKRAPAFQYVNSEEDSNNIKIIF